MDIKNDLRFFLGANSRHGFYSLYDDFVSPENGDFLWVIKGGPGCGKSSFMKKIGAAAEKAGLKVEYILCSGDPNSLDGIYIPEKKVGYIDGTSPHVIEAKHLGAADLYLNLGTFYDTEQIQKHLPELMELQKAYKAMYERAYTALAAAAAVSPVSYPLLTSEQERKSVLRRAGGSATREFGKKTSGQGKIKRRFISSITYQGRIFLEDTINTICDKVYTLDDEYGLGEIYISRILQDALHRGLEVILCPDPLSPEIPEALLIPELRLGFVTISSRRGYSGKPYRHIRLDAIIPAEKIREARPKLRSAAKLREDLLLDAESSLQEAKRKHDEIENLYNPHVDFSGLYKVADEHIELLLK